MPPSPRSTGSPPSSSDRRRSSALARPRSGTRLRPADIRDDEEERHAVPDKTFAWVHLDDLVSLVADVATSRVKTSDDPERGPVEGGCTAVNVAGSERATTRDYFETVTKAVGVDPVWDDAPAWTGRILADRAHGWGWSPRVTSARRSRRSTKACAPATSQSVLWRFAQGTSKDNCTRGCDARTPIRPDDPPTVDADHGMGAKP